MLRRPGLLLAGPVLALVACAGPVPAVHAPAGSTGELPARARGSAEPRPPPSAFDARVDRVVDGDTFIAVRRGARVRVRLIGVDTPETVRPGWPVECWGPQASRLLTRLLPVGSPVRAAYQPGGRRDRYGRDLWDVWLPDGRFLQAVLVRRGAAVAEAYRPQVAHAGYLQSLEATARARQAGRFGACRASPT